MTAIQHVGNLIRSCKIDFELTKLSCYLAKIYGPKLTMHTKRKHDYLGVDLEFCEDGSLEMSMVKFKNVIEGFPDMIAGKLPTPAGDRLFNTQDKKDAKPLDEERAMALNYTTAQLIFMATRAQ